MIAVRLLRAFGTVNAGEVAGYPEEQVGQMIADGIAEIYDPEREAEAAAAEAAAAEAAAAEAMKTKGKGAADA